MVSSVWRRVRVDAAEASHATRHSFYAGESVVAGDKSNLREAPTGMPLIVAIGGLAIMLFALMVLMTG